MQWIKYYNYNLVWTFGNILYGAIVFQTIENVWQGYYLYMNKQFPIENCYNTKEGVMFACMIKLFNIIG